MSEPTSEPTEGQETEKPDEQGNPDEAALGDAGKKALDAMKAKWKAAEKELGLATAKLTELEQAKLSDLEKAQQAAKDAQEQALRAGTDALRYRIASEKGITDHVDLILTAPDEETMRQQADLWAARTPTTAAGPRPDLSQGGSGGTPPSDPAAQFAEFIKSQRAG